MCLLRIQKYKLEKHKVDCELPERLTRYLTRLGEEGGQKGRTAQRFWERKKFQTTDCKTCHYN